MDPRQGEYTYYTIQHRKTHQTEWLKPDDELKPVEKKDHWSMSCFDWMGFKAQPWAGKGNDWKPIDKKAHDQISSVRSMTGSKGWWDLEYAMKALARLMKASEEGEFVITDTYGKPHQAQRFEFRIVRVRWFKKIDPISLTDAVMALGE
jgi:hypothetical protein